jgi:hypothetical protein
LPTLIAREGLSCVGEHGRLLTYPTLLVAAATRAINDKISCCQDHVGRLK